MGLALNCVADFTIQVVLRRNLKLVADRMPCRNVVWGGGLV